MSKVQGSNDRTRGDDVDAELGDMKLRGGKVEFGREGSARCLDHGADAGGDGAADDHATRVVHAAENAHDTGQHEPDPVSNQLRVGITLGSEFEHTTSVDIIGVERREQPVRIDPPLGDRLTRPLGGTVTEPDRAMDLFDVIERQHLTDATMGSLQ